MTQGEAGSSPPELAGPGLHQPAREMASQLRCGKLNRSGNIFSRLNVQLNKGQIPPSERPPAPPASPGPLLPRLACCLPVGLLRMLHLYPPPLADSALPFAPPGLALALWRHAGDGLGLWRAAGVPAVLRGRGAHWRGSPAGSSRVPVGHRGAGPTAPPVRGAARVPAVRGVSALAGRPVPL